MTAPSPPTPTAPASTPSVVRESRRTRISRRFGCLAVWLVFVTPVLYSLLLVYRPALGFWLADHLSWRPHFVPKWLEPGPARSLDQWLGNVDAGPTMVYLIFAAVLVLFTLATFVRDEPRPPRPANSPPPAAASRTGGE